MLDLAENSSLGSLLTDVQQLLSAVRDNVLPALAHLLLSPPLDPDVSNVLLQLTQPHKRLHNDSLRYSHLNQLIQPDAALDLSFCRLRRLPFDSHSVSFAHVTHLNLSFNSLSGQLPQPVFGMSQLQALVVVSACLSGPLPVELARLSRLRILSLAHNAITALPEELFSSLTLLEHVDLRFNRLSLIPSSVSKLSCLRDLYIQHNCVVSLPPSIFSLNNLAALQCLGNPMHPVLVEVYHRLAQGGSALSLAGRGVAGLPAEVALLSNCTELLLSHNKLSWLPPQICRMKSLVAVDISFNLFESIPPCLALLSLTVFKFDNNPLSHVSIELQKVYRCWK
jgi:internalin A